MMKRAAIYARYSSDQQSARSIDDQVALCRSFAERAGFAAVAVYSDYEISGATVHRPQFERLCADAQSGGFDVIVAEDTDRLARGEGDMPQLRRNMEFLGIEIHTCADGLVTKMTAGFKGLMNSMFLDNLAQKTHRGLAGAVRRGKSPGGRSYGYRPVKGEPGELMIERAEAAVVLRIFTEYADGKNPREIAAGLNADHIPPPRQARRWNASTINGNHKRGHGILLNPIYAGTLIWNRVRMVKNPANGKRVSRPNPPEQHQAIERPAWRIVPPALFETVQKRKRALAHLSLPQTRRPKRLLSGLLRCGCCGGGLTAKGRDQTGRTRLHCSTRRESGNCRNARSFYADDVERRVVEGLRAKLQNPKYLAAYVAEYNAERRRLAAKAGTDRDRLERRAAENAREIESAIDAIVKGTVDHATMRPRMAALTAERDRLTGELAQGQATGNVVALHPGAVAAYRADMEMLATAIAGGHDGMPGEPAAALRRLVARVVIHPGKGLRAPYVIEIEGRLAALLGLPGTFAGEALQGGSLVAGNRYRQSPFTGPMFSIRLAA